MKSLPNYLQTQRKRLALSQEEVGFLLGIRGMNKENKVCRDESFARKPSLQDVVGDGVGWAFGEMERHPNRVGTDTLTDDRTRADSATTGAHGDPLVGGDAVARSRVRVDFHEVLRVFSVAATGTPLAVEIRN